MGGTVPTALMYFSVYEAARPLLERWMPEQPARVHLGSAAAGALASSVFRVPGDSVRHQVTCTPSSSCSTVFDRSHESNHGVSCLARHHDEP